MPFSFSEFNWRLIVLMIAVSAVVSYVGDVVGMKIGKRRVSFLGLRPRYTSTVITILTGVAIAVATLGVAAGTSDSVRGALYGSNWLQREISRLTLESREKQEQLDENQAKLDSMEIGLIENQRRMEESGEKLLAASENLQATRVQLQAADEERKGLTSQLEGLKAEKERIEKSVAGLRRESEQLKSGLAEMKAGRMLVSQGELLSQVTVPGGARAAEIEAALDRLTMQAEAAIALKQENRPDRASPVRVSVDEVSRQTTLSRLSEAADFKVLRLTAASNIVQGQAVTGVVRIFDRKLIFQRDAILSRVRVTGGMEPEQAADMLYTFLKQINKKVVELGVLQDPLSGTVGNLDSLEFYNVADQMSEASGDLTITFLAATAIYTEGPVNVKIEVAER